MRRQPGNLHVGLFFSNFNGGGIQRVMLSLAEGLSVLGWRVDLVLVQGVGPLYTEVPDGCRCINLAAGHASQALFKFMDYLKAENPGAILSSQTHLNLVAILARILTGWKGRLVLSEHIALDFSALNPTGWKDRFYPYLAGIFYRWADEIVLVSQDAAQRFLEITHLPEKMVRVVYNPVVSEKLIEQSRVNPGHAWLNVPDQPLLLAAGRLTPQKDFETLLRAFALLRTSLLSAKLIILGEGDERLHLQQLSEDLGLKHVVQFLGFVNNPFAYMANASVFILSSRWEGFANVIVEAMACGTPVVSTDCPSGPAEILENGKYGRLVPIGDPKALAEAIFQELNSPHDQDLLRQRASDFSIDKILPQYLELLFPGQK